MLRRGKRRIIRSGKQAVNADGEGTLTHAYQEGTRDEIAPYAKLLPSCAEKAGIRCAASPFIGVVSAYRIAAASRAMKECASSTCRNLVIASAAKQSRAFPLRQSGLVRRKGPRRKERRVK
jgi:hypothetical protein